MLNNIFLCVDDLDLIKEFLININKTQNGNLVGTSTTIVEDVNQLLALHLDILIINPEINLEKAEILMEELRNHDQLKDLHIIALYSELDGKTVHFSIKHKIDNFLIKPYTCKDIFNVVSLESDTQQYEESIKDNIKTFVGRLLEQKGIPIHLNGHKYLTTAIYLKSEPVFCSLTMKEILVETAKEHGTTYTRVGKSIRTAITRAYKEQPALISLHTGVLEKPTCKALVCFIHNRMRLKEKEKDDIGNL